MIELAGLAGFLASNALLEIAQKENLSAIYAYGDENNDPIAIRMAEERIEDGVAKGKEFLESNPYNSRFAILIHDMLFHADPKSTAKVDVLHIECRIYGEQEQKILMGLPYKHDRPTEPHFGVFNLDVYEIPLNMSGDEIDQIFGAFFEGVADFPEGSELWHANTLQLPANVNKHEAIFNNMGVQSVEYVYSEDASSAFVEKHDDAAWHYTNDSFPDDLPPEAGATHIGMFVAWCLLNGLSGRAVEIKELADRSVTPGMWFFNTYNGQFTLDLLSDRGNAFTKDYFDDYLDDYESLMPEGILSLYHFSDSWENYDALDKLIRSRFEALAA